LYQAAVRLLPLVLLMSIALGLVVIGQSVSLLTQVGAQKWLGTVMVAAVVRELGPLLTAMLVLARSGTANVIELGTARALGEVESLEVMGVDPIHYLVVPRVIGLSLGIFALTVYLILGAVVSGYVWGFLQDVPMSPGEYFQQLASALMAWDFVLLVGKALSFGAIIGIVTSYHGLAQPLRLEEVSQATVRAVGQSMVLCVAAELAFIVLYLFV